MGKEHLIFDNMEIEKTKFYQNETPILLKDGDIKKLLVSSKISFGEKNNKCFIGYFYNGDKIKPLHIMLTKTSANVKTYDGQTKGMYFLIEEDNLLEKYNTIWDIFSADIKKEFDNEPVYNKENLKTKTKSHGDEVYDFKDKEISNVDSNHNCLAVISLDFALKKDESYYTQVFLKECKYIEKKLVRQIQDNLGDFSYSSNESDEE